MKKKLDMVREIVSCLCGIDVNIVSTSDGSLQTLIRDSFEISTLQLVPEGVALNHLTRLEENCVYMVTILSNLSYIIIRIPDETQYLVVGPCLTDEFSESKLRSYLRPLKLDTHTVLQIISYYSWQPTLSHEKFYQLGNLLARHLLSLSEPFAHKHLEYHIERLNRSSALIPDTSVSQSEIREVEKRYEISTALTEAVKQGNLSLALRLLQNTRLFSPSLIRSSNPLRNAKNFCIIMNTQLRHSMEENRIHPYQLDVVSTDIAKRIESLKSLEEASNYFAQILHKYCDLAMERNFSHLSDLSRQAVTYIKMHLAENVSVKDTAKALLVNANYLSGKFHQEMKMTFTAFVNKERTAQAAALLSKTTMQIQQIAVTVGYDNVSYFSKQFSHFYGKTPREYRRENLL